MLDNNNVWVSGSKGSILKSTDSGVTWTNTCPETYQKLDFRGLFAINKSTVLAISAGNAEDSMAVILKTSDAGKTWEKVFQSTEKGVFFDAIKFVNNKVGFILSDAIDEKPYLLKTTNAGKTWKRIDKNIFPNIIKGEASFAASNSCISVFGNNVWFNTQNRIFKSENMGKTWVVYNTEFGKSESKGIFGIFFYSATNGIAVGGDYLDKTTKTLQLAMTVNGGASWISKPINIKAGLTECASITTTNKIIVASLQGVSVTNDFGKNWNILDSTPFHAVSCNKTVCFSVGGNGKIGRWEF
jgi:photosystem II stability/assembly factor-like uncharacterized protein